MRRSSRRSAFTLVELLTVIGIISLLISILVPSLVQARNVARKTATLAEIDAMSKGLEMFENDYKSYPSSDSGRFDPVLGGGAGLPGLVSGDVRLYGAHWVVRALVGPDMQGADTGGAFLKDRPQTDVDSNNKIAIVQSGGSGITALGVQTADRRGTYIDTQKLIIRDTDARLIQTNGPASGRLVMIDSFSWPILYYKANPRAQRPFCNVNSSGRWPSGTSDALGIYNQNDNIGLTGGAGVAGWDFAGTGQGHGLGFFGPTQAQMSTYPPTDVDSVTPGPEYKGKSFASVLHDHKIHETGEVIKPVKPEGYVLISPGKDGIYGTDDDVNNFDR